MIFAQYYLRLWMNGRTEHEECRRSGGVVYTAPSPRILGKILGTGSDRRHVTLTFKFTRFTVSNCAFTYLLEDLLLIPRYGRFYLFHIIIIVIHEYVRKCWNKFLNFNWAEV